MSKALLEDIEHVPAAVVPPGGADLPEVRGHHRLDVSPPRGESEAMKERLLVKKLSKDSAESRFGNQRRLHVGVIALLS
jgi:hypothetical protein